MRGQAALHVSGKAVPQDPLRAKDLGEHARAARPGVLNRAAGPGQGEQCRQFASYEADLLDNYTLSGSPIDQDPLTVT